MTFHLYVALYFWLALVLCACVYGYALGEFQRVADENEARIEARRQFFASLRAERLAEVEELAERRKAHFRRINNLSAQQAHSARVEGAARTWSA